MTDRDRPELTTLDEAAFGALVEPHRRELHVHCYRMLGSFEDAEDQVQETLLRAWRSRGTFAGRSSLRTWLYRIATNACLDALDRRPRPPLGAAGEVPWLQPYPDELLAEIADPRPEPHAAAVDRETIELAFLVAIQHLPPRTRAVLLARDVLGLSARATAEHLGITVAAVNSALQRARAGLARHLPPRRAEWAAGADPTAAERELLRRYIDASEGGDVAALGEVLAEDVAFSMPPQAGVWTGRETVLAMWTEDGFGGIDMRCRPTRANRQPAVAAWMRRPGDVAYRALAIDVLRVVEGRVAEIVTFPSRSFPAFRLPEVLEPGEPGG